MDTSFNFQNLLYIFSLLAFGIAIGIVFVRILQRKSKSKGARLEMEVKETPGQIVKQQPVPPESDGPSELPELPAELVDACAAGECILFAGSGLATAAGYPTRGAFLLHLAEREDEKEVADLVRAGDLDSAAEILAALDQETIFKYLLEAYQPKGKGLSPLEQVLAKIPFIGATTTAWDDVIPRACAKRDIDVAVLLPQEVRTLDQHFNVAESKTFFLIRLYGVLERPDTVFLSPSRQADEVLGNSALLRFVSTQFVSRTLFFCGAALDEIEHFLNAFRIQGPGNHQHFALVAREPSLDAKRKMFANRYGIHLLPFQPTDGHPEVLEFLKNLEGDLHKKDRPKRMQIKTRTLTSLRLENIGPFQDLVIDLNKGWNVLLGNNGCGKSTILRAIAAGLCGEFDEARGNTASLLKNKSNRGSINLQIGGETVHTELKRETSRIKVESRRATPLESGSWTVLGFPPLRGVAGNINDPSSEGQPDLEGPDVRDVIPLLKDIVDQRMVDLKHWIVDTEVAAKQGDARADGLLESFFSLLATLMPGVRFKRTKDSSPDVVIETDDGRVPIDLISQGMSSVISWAGYLMQRLAIIHPNSKEPQKEHALVLVDELDAHMHPEWQTAIVDGVKKCFPNVQVIATTHSPLIVANMEKEEIHICGREAGHVWVEPAPESYQGWRADQILTGPAFNLPGARDADTNRDLSRYLELVSRSDLSPGEQADLEDLAEKINRKLPSTAERASAMKAYDVLSGAIEDRLRDLPADEKDEIRREIRIQLQGSTEDTEGP